MSYLVLVGVWFVSFLSFSSFIIGSKSLCLFIHKTINNMKMIISISFLLLFSLISCNTTDPKLEPDLKLELKDISCTEVWLQLTTNNIQLPTTINLLKNNAVTQTFSLSTKDSLLFIDSLLPNQNYKIIVTMQQSNNASNELSVTTMDTTSHNFTWQTFTFGESDASWIYDIAIIDDNNIWAVGEIYMNDSLGNPDPSLYNLIKWDGISWKPERVYFKDSQGQLFLAPMKSIFAFNENDIWIGLDQIIHWDGTIYKSIELSDVVFQSWINKIWGSSSNDLYIVGNDGNIAHYGGSSVGWKKIESGTTSIINDVWGITNSQSNTILYCPVSSFFVPGNKKILKIVDGKVDSVIWNRDVRLYSAWTNNENFLCVCGEGVYANKFGIWIQINLPPIGTNSVRGNNINDIFVVGDQGFITHFNGSTWQIIGNYNNKGYSKVSILGDVVAICGNHQGRGIIEIGKRN